MEIEFENYESGDNISDRDAERFFFPRGFSCVTKNELSVWGAIVGRMKTMGLRKTTLCAPRAEKV